MVSTDMSDRGNIPISGSWGRQTDEMICPWLYFSKRARNWTRLVQSQCLQHRVIIPCLEMDMDFKLTLCLCNILNTTTFLHWALCPYYDQALWSCQATFPLRTNGTWTLYKAEAAARTSCLFLSCWILPFCTQRRGKTYKLLDQRKLNSSMRESGKGLFCPFLSICPPWMQKVFYLVLWGKSQNFQNFGSVPASILVLLSCFLYKLFPEMVRWKLRKKSEQKTRRLNSNADKNHPRPFSPHTLSARSECGLVQNWGSWTPACWQLLAVSHFKMRNSRQQLT